LNIPNLDNLTGESEYLAEVSRQILGQMKKGRLLFKEALFQDFSLV